MNASFLRTNLQPALRQQFRRTMTNTSIFSVPQTLTFTSACSGYTQQFKHRHFSAACVHSSFHPLTVSQRHRAMVQACSSPLAGNNPISKRLPFSENAATELHRDLSTSSRVKGNVNDKDNYDNEDEDDFIKIKETDLEEQFVRGSGAGGQKINKSSVCVVLKHIPTGIIVRCQETRSQVKNREIARKLLQGKLDEIVRGEESEAAKEASKARARKAKRRKRSVTKHFKSRNDRMLLDI